MFVVRMLAIDQGRLDLDPPALGLFSVDLDLDSRMHLLNLDRKQD